MRFFSLTQLISCESIRINDIYFINQDIFAIAGKRIIYYDNTVNRKIKNQFDIDVFPCQIMYSETYDVLIVITK